MRGINPHEAKLRRMRGMSPENRELMERHLGQQNDWRGTCGLCGRAMTGTAGAVSSCDCTASTGAKLPGRMP